MSPPLKKNPTFESLVRAAQEAEEARKQVKLRKVIRTGGLCKTDFRPTRTWQTFCSTSCKTQFHALRALDERHHLQDEIMRLEALVDALTTENETLRKQLNQEEK